MATSSRNSKKYSPSNDPLTNLAPKSKKTKPQSNTRSLRSNTKVNTKLIIKLFYFFFDRSFNLTNSLIYNIQEIRNLLSKDVNEETDYNKNDDDDNNVIVPSDELPLTSVAIPSVEKSLLDKLTAKRRNAKVTNTRYYV